MSNPAGFDALSDVIGQLPYRLQMAGGWIDQPFVSALNPEPPGSMVVVSLNPTVRFMDRCGMATGTRVVARALWGDAWPAGRPVAASNRRRGGPPASRGAPASCPGGARQRRTPAARPR